MRCAGAELSGDSGVAQHQYWQAQKHHARYQSSGTTLSSVPQHVPSMMQSLKILEAVSQFEFKFDDATELTKSRLQELMYEQALAFHP